MEDKQEGSQERVKGKQGFASIPKEKMREIAGRGGRTAHALGKAHRFTREEAIEAGKKGGKRTSDRFKAIREKTDEEVKDTEYRIGKLKEFLGEDNDNDE